MKIGSGILLIRPKFFKIITNDNIIDTHAIVALESLLRENITIVIIILRLN